jgi:PKD repeat protein
MIGAVSNITEFYPGEGWAPHRSWDTTGYNGYVTIYVIVENVSPAEEIVSNNIFSEQIYIREFNEPPVASFSVSNDNPGIGEDVTFNASLSSDDTGIYYYHFDFGDGETQTSYDPIVTHSYDGGGSYTVSLVVEDEDGEESTNFAEAQITVEAKPHASLTASPKSIYEGDSVTFDGSGSYEQGGEIDYYRFDYGDGQNSGWTSDSSATHTYSSAGSYNATLEVKDDDGDISENVAQVVITVSEKPNSPPNAVIMYITPNPVTQGRDASFYGIGYDDDGEIVAYKWKSDLDGILSDSQMFSTSVLSVGTHTISFSVQDDDGAWSDGVTETLLVKETNELPTVTISYPSDFQRVSGTLNIQGTAEDPDGDVLWVEIRIDASQWVFALGTTSWSFGFDTTLFAEGEHTIKARAFDGEDYSEEVAITVVVDNEVDESEKGEGDNQLWIFILIFIIVIVVVVAIIAAEMSGRKKGPAQHPPPQQVEPIVVQPGTRINW